MPSKQKRPTTKTQRTPCQPIHYRAISVASLSSVAGRVVRAAILGPLNHLRASTIHQPMERKRTKPIMTWEKEPFSIEWQSVLLGLN